MNRKEFIGNSIKAGFIPVMLGGFSVKTFADSPLVAFLNKAGNEDRVLVLIQLNGGNDGLNTVIPLDQYSKLYSARQNIIIDETKVLSLSGTLATGLHPALAEMRSLYNNGKVSIIQSVGYPNPDFSHFRSTDIWLTASDSDKYVDTGWMGRYLDTKFPGFPTGYPNATYPDPPAIQIGAMVSPALQGNAASLGMSITDPTSFYQFVSGTVDPAPATPAGHELTFLRLVAQQTEQYSGSIKAAATAATNLSTLYPTTGTNTLADQLKIVARLIAGGLKTRVYMVSLGGFDNHSAQVVTGATDTGTHATLLQKISVAVNAFQNDLELLNIDNRVLGMTFSEFGRRIKSNASLGTDHGAAAPLFIFGKKVNGGLYGPNPTIPTGASGGDNVPMGYDFRAIYATLLKDWFEVSDADLTSIMLKQFTTLPFVNSNATSLQKVSANGLGVLDNYPNPASTQTTIRFTSNGESVKIKLFDNTGKELMELVDGNCSSGVHEILVNTESFKNGMYYYQLQNGNFQKTRTMVISR